VTEAIALEASQPWCDNSSGYRYSEKAHSREERGSGSPPMRSVSSACRDRTIKISSGAITIECCPANQALSRSDELLLRSVAFGSNGGNPLCQEQAGSHLAKIAVCAAPGHENILSSNVD